jgi:hypothetical protein
VASSTYCSEGASIAAKAPVLQRDLLDIAPHILAINNVKDFFQCAVRVVLLNTNVQT